MRVFLDSLGCRLNQSEIDRMASEFRASGHQPTGSAADAELVVVNTCAVTLEADRDSRQRIRQAHALNPSAQIVATGCWSTLAPGEAAGLPGVSRVVDNAQKDRLVHLLQLPRPEPTAEFDLEPVARVPLPGVRHRTRAFVKAQDGCDNRCTFCVTTVARGEGRSREAGEIVADVRAAQAGGALEAVLTGVHLGSYGHDLGNKLGLAGLVTTLLDRTDIPRLRLSSIEPWDIGPEFFELWRNPRLCRHLHLPLQSGCAATLKRMARRTTPESFAELVNAARSALPRMAITTDVIVGFPGETEAEFQQSLDFVRRMEFAGAHAFRYSSRPGTAAARMSGRVSGPAKRERRAAVLEAVRVSERAYRESFLGQTLPVIWESASGASEAGIHWTGLTDNYLRVTAPSPNRLWNTLAPATLIEVTENGLSGRVFGGGPGADEGAIQLASQLELPVLDHSASAPSPFRVLERAMSLDPNCIFCKIVSGASPAAIVHQDESVTAFRDLNPAAPTHLLIVPNEHLTSVAEAGEEHAGLLGRLLVAANRLAEQEGISAGGYRLVINTGRDAGQAVHHLHLHLLGGRRMTWPPG